MSNKMETKTSTNKSFNRKMLLTGIAGLALMAGFCATLILGGKKESIAIYGLEEKQTECLKNELQTIATQKKLDIEIISLDSTKPLASQIPQKCLGIITTSGYGTREALSKAGKKAGLSSDLISEMTSSIRGSAKFSEKTKKLAALPILSDNLEIDIELSSYKNSQMTAISTWNDIEYFIKLTKKYQDSSIYFAAANPVQFMDIMGALAEAIDGSDSYNKAAEILKSNQNKKFDAVKLASELADKPNSPLVTSIRYLKKLYKDKIISDTTFNFTKRDLNAYIRAGLVPAAIMTLSDHRNMEQQVIAKYSSIYFPSDKSASQRSFTSTTIHAVPLKQSNTVEKLFSELVTTETQEKLSRSTGLAPVLSHCRTPDKQADDVRYWIAATNSPHAGLGHEAFFSPDQIRAISKELISKISN